jgi:hypothetical protein
VITAVADEPELVHVVATAATIDDRPSALRWQPIAKCNWSPSNWGNMFVSPSRKT